MAGTILAEIVLEGGQKFTRTVSNATEEVDQLGDEAEETDREVGRLSKSFSSLSVGTEGISARIGTFGRGLKSIIPILGTLAVVAGGLTLALAPLVLGMVAIGGAIGLIVGSGILAWGKGFGKAMNKAKKEIVPMVKAFGKQFIPFLKETIGLLPGLVKAILNAIGPMDPFINALKQIRDVAIQVLPKLIGWFFDLGREVLPIVLRFTNILIKNLLPALKAIVNAGQGIGRFIGQIITRFKQASKRGNVLGKRITRLKQAFSRFWTALQPVLKALGPLFKQLAKVAGLIGIVALDVLTLAINLGAKLLPVLVPVINFITGLVTWFNKLSPQIRAAVVVIGGLIAAAGPLIGILGTIFSALTTVVTAVGTVIAIFDPFTLALIALGVTIGGLAYLIYKHWDQIIAATQRFVSSIVGFFTDLGNKIDRFGRNASNAINQFANDAVQWFRDLHTRAAETVSNMVGTLMDYLLGRRGPLSDIESAGRSIIQGFINGVKSKIGDVKRAIGDVMQKARNMLPFSPAKEGPLSDLDKAGPAFVETFARGIRQSEDVAVSAAQSVAQSVMSVFDETNQQQGLFAGEQSRVSLKGMFKGMPSGLIADLLENFTEGQINVGKGFQPLSSVIGLKEYARSARDYGFIERRDGRPVFYEDTPIVAIENLLNDEAINFKVDIDTDDEALKAWVDNRADLTVNRNVSQALRQANRRRTFR